MSTRVCVFAVPAATDRQAISRAVAAAFSDGRAPKDLFVRFASDSLAKRTGLRFFSVDTTDRHYGQHAPEWAYESVIAGLDDFVFVVHDDMRGRYHFQWHIDGHEVFLRSEGPMVSGPRFLLDIEYPQRPFSNEALERLHHLPQEQLGEAEARAIQDWWNAARLGFAQLVPSLGVHEYLEPFRATQCWAVYPGSGAVPVPDGLLPVFAATMKEDWFTECKPRLDLSEEELVRRERQNEQHFYWRNYMTCANPQRIGRCLAHLIRLIELGAELGYMYAAEMFRERGAAWLALRLYRDSVDYGHLREWIAVGEILVDQRFGQRALNAFEWCDEIRTNDRSYRALQERARQLFGQPAQPRHLAWDDIRSRIRDPHVLELAAAAQAAAPFDRARALHGALQSPNQATVADAVSMVLAALDTWAHDQLVDADWPPPYADPPPDYLGEDELAEAIELLNNGEPMRALAKIDEAIALGPNTPVFRHDRGVILRELGRADEALAEWLLTIDLDVGHESAYINASSVLMDSQRDREAVNLLNRAIAMVPDAADLYYNRACAHAKLRDKSSMLHDLEQCFELDPQQTLDVEADDDFSGFLADEELVALLARFDDLR